MTKQDEKWQKFLSMPIHDTTADKIITWGEYRQESIDYWNRQEYVQRIRAKMQKFKPLFADMKTPRGFSYNDVLVCSAPDYINTHNLDAVFHEMTLSIEITGQAMRRRPDLVLLHEMIHLHEYLLTDRQRKNLYKKLFAELSGRIPNLDAIMWEYSDIIYTFFRDEKQEEAHSDLFFLKSLDIDLHFPKKYKPGTVGSYGFDVAIKIIQNDIAEQEKNQAAEHSGDFGGPKGSPSK